MKLRKVLLALAALLALAGCSGGWHGTGTVTAKYHSEGVPMVVMNYCGKGCYFPSTVYTAPDWQLLVHASDGDHWVEVNQDYWNCAKAGDKWKDG